MKPGDDDAGCEPGTPWVDYWITATLALPEPVRPADVEGVVET